jgi:nicotinamidase-related amidase
VADLEHKFQGLGQNPALVIVDMINAFTDPACPLGSEADDVVAANQRLLEIFRASNLHVFFTTVIYHKENQALVFRERVPALNILVPGSHWVEIDSRLQPAVGEAVIEKQWASAFFRTDLAERLQAAGADSLVVTGLTTSGCVRATAVDGLQHDYRVVVPVEAVGDRNQEAHRANLFDLNAKYADVLKLNEVLNFL